MRAFLYVVLPAALLIGALYSTFQSFQTPVEQTAAKIEEPPRYSVTGAQWVRLGPRGEPEFRAQAAVIEYYADESAKLHAVSLDSLGGAQSPWHLEAPQGRVPARERRILLSGGVEAKGEHVSGVPIAFDTQRLWVDLLRRELYTEARVDLQTDFRSATARGMRADFAGEHVQLLNDVQVDYAPEG